MHHATPKVAFAAYLNALGEFAQQAGVVSTANATQNPTALAWELIAPHLPEGLQSDMAPFAKPDMTADNAAHTTDSQHASSLLQCILATATQLAYGPQASNQRPAAAPARLQPLFAHIRLQDTAATPRQNTAYGYPLSALSPQSIFPQTGADTPTQAEYAALWQAFVQGLAAIPASHRQQWDLWLDHFDTLWQTYAQAIPADASPSGRTEVSLYDHSKTAAALAVALWRWHHAHGQTDEAAISRLHNRDDWQEPKILLIQGDFFGIQNFIFASGSQTQKRAAKLLRGRSFQVSLFAELAALKILQACQLPPGAQILNAAGKFMIVAPNSDEVHAALAQVKAEINAWFLQHSFGQVALGIAAQSACCADFTEPERFERLLAQSFAVLEQAKLQRFELTDAAATVLPCDYSLGVCRYNQQLPADSLQPEQAAALSLDQISLGSLLTRQDRLLILNRPQDIRDSRHTQKLRLPIFGLYVVLTAEEELSGYFGKPAREGHLLRCWDFSLPQNDCDTLWHGYARRYINAYVPHFQHDDEWLEDKYRTVLADESAEEVRAGQPKTFNHLACEERRSSDGRHFSGKVAIAALKGDVDNLGLIFQQGMNEPSFAKMAALSRQMNLFFSLWLPAHCARHFPNCYTVFAGGDDFFLIGPWLQTQRLAASMREHFSRYVADNPEINFSAGITVCKPGLPVAKLSAYAEEALEQAKQHRHPEYGTKNSCHLYGQSVSWPQWQQLENAFARIDGLKTDYGLSTGFVYGMLEFSEAAEQERSGHIEAGIWRSRLAYRIRRYVNDNKHIGHKNNAYQQLLEAFYQNGLNQLGGAYRIPLFNHFYLLRAR
ncbi:CRISPR-associated protein Csm1 [Neisseria sp. HSC-16F19]|nr:type III-A CRISPR-associated protein Cas10/Csm1 [Neisseria sp. HSC-16F19]MCP2041869.1 CRISPR-associated protein Csm1 [Neisseria sp. HSC-16F19]